MIFVWHGIRHFNSYALLGSQSYFENPRPEWIILGILQIVIGGLLFYKSNPWYSFAAAFTLFLWCVAYPVSRHGGDAVFILLLLGLTLVQLGGDGWIPLATLPSAAGMTMAGLWKLHGNDFSICDLTNCVLVRYPWMDGINLSLNQHEIITRFLSNLIMGMELASPGIWILLFFPRFWLLRSLLALLSISLLFGIGITGNLDEFPWIILTTWLLMIGPKKPDKNHPPALIVYPVMIFLSASTLLNIEINLQAIYFKETDPLIKNSFEILPHQRIGKMALFLFTPIWDMYARPQHNQVFGGENNRMRYIQSRIVSNTGCGLDLNRWERIYWSRIDRGLRNRNEHQTAITLKDRYQSLMGMPCSTIVAPTPVTAALP
jgi:hypothetical protein